MRPTKHAHNLPSPPSIDYWTGVQDLRAYGVWSQSTAAHAFMPMSAEGTALDRIKNGPTHFMWCANGVMCMCHQRGVNFMLWTDCAHEMCPSSRMYFMCVLVSSRELRTVQLVNAAHIKQLIGTLIRMAHAAELLLALIIFQVLIATASSVLKRFV